MVYTEPRPGIPMETAPRPLPGAKWRRPQQQEATVKVFKRVGLDRLTPVFGTRQPPKGLSGLMRGLAYQIPEHRASHWLVLLAADRVDVIEGLIVDGFVRKPFAGFFVLGAVGYALFKNNSDQQRGRSKNGKIRKTARGYYGSIQRNRIRVGKAIRSARI